MNVATKEQIKTMKAMYPVGSRVVLDEMKDTQAPAIGTHGTVLGVDDIGSLLVRWDNGSGLHVLFGIDRCHRVIA